jgi:hypothetical protein
MAVPRRYPPDIQASGGEAALITSFLTTEVRLTLRPMVFIRTSEAVHGFQKGGRETAGNQNDLKERGRREWRAGGSWFLDHHHLSGVILLAFGLRLDPVVDTQPTLAILGIGGHDA